jgi:group I intron endonuclease
MCTYRVTNTTNGKFYIGSTKNFKNRKREHLRSTENYPFQNALRKNPEAFEWEVFSDDIDEPLLEQALLDMWFGKACCYNLCPTANRPPAHPEISSRTGKKLAQLKVGCHDPKNASKGGKISGRAAVINQTGIHDPCYKENCRHYKSRAGKARAEQAKKELWVDPEHPELGSHHFNTLKKLQREWGYPSGKQNKVKIAPC